MMEMILLPYRWKYVGWMLLTVGIILAGIYLTNEFTLRMPVFAVFSSFMETRMFVTFKTNVADDIILLLLVTGFGMSIGSRERVESEKMDLARGKAFTKAFLWNTLLLLFCILFVYGGGFLGVLIFNLFSFSILYLVFFNLLKSKI
jgi:hypothetical protein